MYKCLTWDQHSKMFWSLYSHGVMRAKPSGTERVLSLDMSGWGKRIQRRKRGKEQKIPAVRDEERRWTGEQSKRSSGLVIRWMEKRSRERCHPIFTPFLGGVPILSIHPSQCQEPLEPACFSTPFPSCFVPRSLFSPLHRFNVHSEVPKEPYLWFYQVQGHLL